MDCDDAFGLEGLSWVPVIYRFCHILAHGLWLGRYVLLVGPGIRKIASFVSICYLNYVFGPGTRKDEAQALYSCVEQVRISVYMFLVSLC